MGVSSSPPDAPLLTRMLATCVSPGELLALCRMHRPHLNFIHASAALVALAKMAEQQAELKQRHQHQQQQQQQQQLQRLGSAAAPGRFQARFPSPPTRSQHSLPSSSNQGVERSTDLAECALLTSALVRGMADSLPPRALANCLWAAAKLVSVLPAEGTLRAAAAGEGGGGTNGDFGGGEGAAHAGASCFELALLLLAGVPRVAHAFEPQHISNSVYAMAALYTAAAAEEAGPGAAAPGSVAAGMAVAGVDGGSRAAGAAAEAAAVDSQRTGQGAPSLGISQTAGGTPPAPHQVLGRCCVERGLPPVDCEGVVMQLLQRSWPMLPQLGPQAIANVLYSLAVLGHQPDGDWLSDALDAAQPLLPKFEPRHISTSLWALAKLEYHPGDEWLGLALDAAALKLPLCSPQALANMAWALAKLGYVDQQGGGAAALPFGQQQYPGAREGGGGLARLMGELLAQAPAFGPQDCSNSLWALATLYRLQRAAVQAVQSVASLPGMGESSAAVGPPASGLWLRCCEALLRRACECRAGASPQQLCNALWAASVLLPSAVQRVLEGIGAGDSRTGGQRVQDAADASFTNNSLALRRLSGPAAAAALAPSRTEAGSGASGDARSSAALLALQLQRHGMQRCKPQELSNAALACARLGLSPPPPSAPARELSASAGTSSRPPPNSTGSGDSTAAEQPVGGVGVGSDWWSSFWSASVRLLPSAEPQHVANMLWSAQAAGQAPPRGWLDAALLRAGETGGAAGSARTLTFVLCLAARLRVRPSWRALVPLLRQAEVAAAAAAPGDGQPVGPRELAKVLWAVCCLTRGARDQAELSLGPTVRAPVPLPVAAGPAAAPRRRALLFGSRDGEQGARDGSVKQQPQRRLMPWEVVGTRGTAAQAPLTASTGTAVPAAASAASEPAVPPTAAEELSRIVDTLTSRFLCAANLASARSRDLSVGTLALLLLRARPPADAKRRLADAWGVYVPALTVRELGVMLVALPGLGFRPSRRLLAQAKARAMELAREEGQGQGGAGGSVRSAIRALQQQQQQLGQGQAGGTCMGALPGGQQTRTAAEVAALLVRSRCSIESADLMGVIGQLERSLRVGRRSRDLL